MANYVINETGERNEQKAPIYKVLYNGVPVFSGTTLQVSKYLIRYMQNGDTWQEVHINSDPSVVMTQAQFISIYGHWGEVQHG